MGGDESAVGCHIRRQRYVAAGRHKGVTGSNARLPRHRREAGTFIHATQVLDGWGCDIDVQVGCDAREVVEFTGIDIDHACGGDSRVVVAHCKEVGSLGPVGYEAAGIDLHQSTRADGSDATTVLQRAGSRVDVLTADLSGREVVNVCTRRCGGAVPAVVDRDIAGDSGDFGPAGDVIALDVHIIRGFELCVWNDS